MRKWKRWIVGILVLGLMGCSSPEEKAYEEAVQLRSAGQVREALELLDPIEARDAELQLRVDALRQEIHEEFFREAVALKQKGDYAGSLAILTRIHTEDAALKARLDSLRQEIQALQQYERALELRQEQRYGEALEQLTAIQYAPLQSQIALEREAIYRQLFTDATWVKAAGDLTGALAMLDRIDTADADLQRQIEELREQIQQTQREEEETAAIAERIAAEQQERYIEALQEDDPQARGNAAWALGEIKAQRAVEPLIEALRDDDAAVREKAAWALGELDDRRAIEPLIALIQDDDSYVREKALTSLERLTGQAFGPNPEAWADWWRRQR